MHALPALSPPVAEMPALLTLQLDDKRTAIKLTDAKFTARENFLEMGELPKPGGANPLLDLWNEHFAVEIFCFAVSSLEITNIAR